MSVKVKLCVCVCVCVYGRCILCAWTETEWEEGMRQQTQWEDEDKFEKGELRSFITVAATNLAGFNMNHLHTIYPLFRYSSVLRQDSAIGLVISFWEGSLANLPKFWNAELLTLGTNQLLIQIVKIKKASHTPKLKISLTKALRILHEGKQAALPLWAEDRSDGEDQNHFNTQNVITNTFLQLCACSLKFLL